MADAKVKYYHQFTDQLQDYLNYFADRPHYEGDRKAGAVALPAEEGQRAVIAKEGQAFAEQIASHYVDIDETMLGKFHPGSIAKTMVRDMAKEGKISDKYLKDYFAILRASFPVEPETALHARQTVPIIMGLAHLHAQTPLTQEGEAAAKIEKPPICYVTCDYTNIGVANDLEKGGIGHANVDKAMRKINDMVRRAAEGNGASGIEVHPCRIGGDENGFIVYGLSAEDMQARLDHLVHPRINLLSAQLGIDELKHKKGGRLPGFGAAFACVDITGKEQSINAELNAAIKQRKELDGYLRFGLTDEAGVERYIKEIYKPYRLQQRGKQLPTIAEKREELLTKVMPAVREEWNHLISEAGVYGSDAKLMLAFQSTHKGNKPQNPREFFDFVKGTANPGKLNAHLPAEQRAEIIQMRRDALLETPKRDIEKFQELTPEKRIPFYQDSPPPRLEDPVITRMRWMMDKIGFSDIAKLPAPLEKVTDSKSKAHLQQYRLTDEAKALLKGIDKQRGRELRLGIDLMHLYEARDPVSRVKTKLHMVDDTKLYLKAPVPAGEAAGIRALRIGVENLGGVNPVSDALADAILRRTGDKIIRETLEKEAPGTHASEFLYHEGNGQFTMYLPASYDEEKVSRIAQAIDKQFNAEVRGVKITQFADETYAKPRDFTGVENVETHIAHDAERISQLKAELVESLERQRLQPLAKLADIPHPSGKKRLSLSFYSDILDHTKDLGQELAAFAAAAEKAAGKIGGHGSSIFKKI